MVQDEMCVLSIAAATSVSKPPAKAAKGTLSWRVEIHCLIIETQCLYTWLAVCIDIPSNERTRLEKSIAILCWTISGYPDVSLNYLAVVCLFEMAMEDFFDRKWSTYAEFENDFKQYCSDTKQVFSVIEQ